MGLETGLETRPGLETSITGLNYEKIYTITLPCVSQVCTLDEESLDMRDHRVRGVMLMYCIMGTSCNNRMVYDVITLKSKLCVLTFLVCASQIYTVDEDFRVFKGTWRC